LKLLLDTCTFLWLIKGDKRISARVRVAFSDPANEVFLSVISVWEICVKYQLGKLSLPQPPELFLPAERQRHLILALDLCEADSLHLVRLPKIHRDPFDRMLVCQAIEHSLTILTPDPLVRDYPIRTFW
jgi:PIN domain nuclease of toxin-antitoxin system